MSDTASRQRALAVFDQVAELQGDARERRLLALCGADDDLLARVRALLAADAAATDPFADAPRWGAALAAAGADGESLLGRSVGAWTLVRIIGRGGMGTVYAAERSDGAYRQQAALKLVRASADSEVARERFLRERQILAQLRHPNIATLLDGGISTSAEPWFAMELVDGEPIDRWCDARRLGLRERVLLFLQVLEAVRYAHRNLVVHRDLKPSNLLVDGEGRVKLLDFGIAKQLQEGELTATLDRALTFEYASPEQLHDAPITTATDLWQLGVVLHRLLTGSHPFGLTRDTPVASQLQQLEREPEPLTRAAAHAPRELAALRGGLSPDALARALRGNLAAIVQACLRRDPEQRYASADALAADLRAWLDDRPIAAVPLSRGQRAQLWLRRNRVLAASLAAVSLALLAGSAVALWQAREARAQTRIAERESASARASLAFLADTFAAAAPERAMATDVSVRTLLDKARAGLDRQPLQPGVRRAVQRLLGRLYGSLGDAELAEELYRAGLQDAQAGNRAEALALAADLDGHADALAVLERGNESLAQARRALALRLRHAADDPLQRFLGERQVAVAYGSLADCKRGGPQWTQAIASAGRIPSPPVVEVARAYVSHARMLFNCGEYAAGLGVADRGLAFADAQALPALSPARADLLWVRSINGSAIGKLRPADAEALLRRAIAIHGKSVGARGAQLGEYYSALGAQLQVTPRMAEALAAHARAAELSRAAGARPIDQAITQYNIGYLYADYGDYPNALAAHARSLAILDRAGIDRDHIEHRRAEKWRARALVYAGRAAEARPLLLDLQRRARALDGPGSVEYLDTVWQLLRAASAMDDVAHGLPLLAEARALAAKFVPPAHAVFSEFLRHEAAFALARGDQAAAERLRREVLARAEAGGDALDIAVTRMELASSLAARGDLDSARPLLAQALPVLRGRLLPQHTNRVRAEALARKLGMPAG